MEFLRCFISAGKFVIVSDGVGCVFEKFKSLAFFFHDKETYIVNGKCIEVEINYVSVVLSSVLSK